MKPAKPFWKKDPSFVYGKRKMVLHSEYLAVYEENQRLLKKIIQLKAEAAEWELAARKYRTLYEERGT